MSKHLLKKVIKNELKIVSNSGVLPGGLRKIHFSCLSGFPGNDKLAYAFNFWGQSYNFCSLSYIGENFEESLILPNM